MTIWHNYMAGKDPQAHSVTGSLRVLEQVHSPQLNNQRDVLVYLPPSYDGGQRAYPVIYMHDGQNLFDTATSYSGEWEVDETMERLAGEGIEAIVVGVPNKGVDRVHELSPYPRRRESKGRGDAYLRFIVETVKPLVDGAFRTQPEREHTGLLGSSMGGLISLYGFFQYGEVFSLAGVFSPAMRFGRGAIFTTVADAPRVDGRIYMDVGTREGVDLGEHGRGEKRVSREFLEDARRMRDMLVEKGYKLGKSLLYVEDEDAIHHESAWARRLPDALRFLLK
jgi:predicted alpha/beta superfamily hydrolase